MGAVISEAAAVTAKITVRAIFFHRGASRPVVIFTIKTRANSDNTTAAMRGVERNFIRMKLNMTPPAKDPRDSDTYTLATAVSSFKMPQPKGNRKPIKNAGGKMAAREIQATEPKGTNCPKGAPDRLLLTLKNGINSRGSREKMKTRLQNHRDGFFIHRLINR